MWESIRSAISKKVSDSLRGKFGPSSRRWKGIDAGYVAKHMWIVKNYGKASKCEICHAKTASRYEWANISGEYKRDISDYMQLCPSCHRKMDGKDYCKNGHRLVPENIYIRKEGWRSCKTCQVLANAKYRRGKVARNKV